MPPQTTYSNLGSFKAAHGQQAKAVDLNVRHFSGDKLEALSCHARVYAFAMRPALLGY